MSFPDAIEDRTTDLFNRGNMLAGQQQYREALECYDEVLSIAPAHLGALNNRGNCLSLLGEYVQATECYDQVLISEPNDLRARCNRASALKHVGRLNEAMADFGHVLALAPNYADALVNRGWTYMEIGHPKEAINDLRRALSLRPNDTDVHTSLIFTLNFDTDATAEAQQAERIQWAAPYARLLTRVAHTNEPRHDRRLRIGYVSRYFFHQAATCSFGGVIVHHDPEQFEVFCYSDTQIEDDFTPHLRNKADKWLCTIGLSDDQLVELIRQDGIDILVDLTGHMTGHRLRAFARKPAPVQITAWGEPTGTGLSAIDYLFADSVLIPKSERTLLAEEVVDLPNFLGFWLPNAVVDPGPLPAIKRGYVTFGSFNRFSKIMDPVLRRWSAILHAVPNSCLVLKGALPLAQEYQRAAIMAVLSEEGISADRVKFLDKLSLAAHFDAYNDIDIALDPFPHSGGMTTLDALWMGVPVVTAPGRTISSRLATATLSAAGLTDFIATDNKSYIQLAVSIANDLPSLAQFRSTLRTRIADSSFGNPIRYTRAVEQQYRAIWKKWCDSQITQKT
jgi:predicted O-linked N-acetylglucosamine transferase (SPINDLY family)